MKTTQARFTRLIFTAILSLGLLTAFTACAPQENKESDPAASSEIAVDNDSAVRGELDTYDPTVEAENVSGKQIEGSEEEELQQERIAGGSVGDVQSQNLEPLEGITDYSEGEYENTYGDES